MIFPNAIKTKIEYSRRLLRRESILYSITSSDVDHVADFILVPKNLFKFTDLKVLIAIWVKRCQSNLWDAVQSEQVVMAEEPINKNNRQFGSSVNLEEFGEVLRKQQFLKQS